MINRVACALKIRDWCETKIYKVKSARALFALAASFGIAERVEESIGATSKIDSGTKAVNKRVLFRETAALQIQRFEEFRRTANEVVGGKHGRATHCCVQRTYSHSDCHCHHAVLPNPINSQSCVLLDFRQWNCNKAINNTIKHHRLL